jgi:hypothetical protein
VESQDNSGEEGRPALREYNPLLSSTLFFLHSHLSTLPLQDEVGPFFLGSMVIIVLGIVLFFNVFKHYSSLDNIW